MWNTNSAIITAHSWGLSLKLICITVPADNIKYGAYCDFWVLVVLKIFIIVECSSSQFLCPVWGSVTCSDCIPPLLELLLTCVFPSGCISSPLSIPPKLPLLLSGICPGICLPCSFRVSSLLTLTLACLCLSRVVPLPHFPQSFLPLIVRLSGSLSSHFLCFCLKFALS